MSTKKALVFFGILVAAAVVLTACGGQAGAPGEPGPQGPQGEPGPAGPAGPAVEVTDLSCTECHNDTTLIIGKETAWEETLHGTGEVYVRGASASCVGCHSGGGFSAMIAAGSNPGAMEAGDPNPTRQDCRACHQIHTTYTGEDWALETTDPVAFYAIPDQTFDGGKGNLCANCHQPRRDAPVAENGMITGINSHWGPHHGPQSAMLLGLAGAGEVEGSPSRHSQVEDTCVACHLGANADHTFEPSVDACLECHDGVENFDINGVQTEIQALLDELEELLIAAGLLDEEEHPIVTEAPVDQATALWNWIYIAHEDKSLGVHNPTYTKALLEYSIELMK